MQAPLSPASATTGAAAGGKQTDRKSSSRLLSAKCQQFPPPASSFFQRRKEREGEEEREEEAIYRFLSELLPPPLCLCYDDQQEKESLLLLLLFLLLALAPKRIPFFPLFPPWWNLFLPLSLCATASFGYKIFFFPRPLYFSRKIHRQNVFFVPSLNYAAFFRASSPPLNFICPRHNFMLIRRCSPFFHPFEIGAVKNPFGIIFQILLHVRSQNHVVSHKKNPRARRKRTKRGQMCM